ncbi:MAG: ComEA family DNA-binding protein [Pseudomonadales bacterium]|nr:ComEA family DNA-binding protein [Pseudomonadales bacterium]
MISIRKYLTVCFTVLLLGLNMAGLPQALAASETAETTTQASTRININTADAQTLASTLKGVGIKKAQAIIEYRKTYGPFAHIEELADVKGIGKATVSKNAHLIAVK